MGWKAFCIIASQHERPQLVDAPRHDVRAANRIAAVLPGHYQVVGSATFEEGIHPETGNLTIGAYAGSLVVGHAELATSCLKRAADQNSPVVDEATSPVIDRFARTRCLVHYKAGTNSSTARLNGDVPRVIETIADVLPGSDVLAIGLHSVVNFYGYAYFQNSTLVRARAGSSDDGVFLNIGDPLPEERPLFAKAVIGADGQPTWREELDGVVEELDHSSLGEDFVFEVSKRYFGERIDCFDLGRLHMSKYRLALRSTWRRLLGR